MRIWLPDCANPSPLSVASTIDPMHNLGSSQLDSEFAVAFVMRSLEPELDFRYPYKRQLCGIFLSRSIPRSSGLHGLSPSLLTRCRSLLFRHSQKAVFLPQMTRSTLWLR